jgi:hypothetical protein
MVTIRNNGILARALGAAALVIAMVVVSGCGEFFGRSDFSSYVMGKTEAEVIDKVGKAASVDASNPAHVTWTYESKTFDYENQNKRDAKTLVIFERDAATGKLKVTDVKFQS